jgi:hypothetical protein
MSRHVSVDFGQTRYFLLLCKFATIRIVALSFLFCSLGAFLGAGRLTFDLMSACALPPRDTPAAAAAAASEAVDVRIPHHVIRPPRKTDERIVGVFCGVPHGITGWCSHRLR